MTEAEDPTASFARLVEERRADLTPAERRVADHILKHSTEAVFLSAVDLARLSRTSDATVVRTARKLGFTGLPELKHALGSQFMATVHPARRLARRITAARNLSGRSLIERIVDESADRLAETSRRFDDEAFAGAIEAMAAATTTVTFGVGLSRVAAEYLSMRLNRIGMPSRLAAHMGFALADDLLPLREGDCVVLFAPGRVLREIDVILRRARQVGATTVVITDSLQNELADRADLYLDAPLSAGGLTGEALTATVVADALMLALAERDEERATTASSELTTLRRDLSAGRS